MKDVLEIACFNCGRKSRISRSKLIVCDFYSCSRKCLNEIKKPEGFDHIRVKNAAGFFNGYLIRSHDETQQIKNFDISKNCRNPLAFEISQAIQDSIKNSDVVL